MASSNSIKLEAKCPDLMSSSNNLSETDIFNALNGENFTHLQLSAIQLEEFLIIQRKRFDLRVNDEPYQALQLLYNLERGTYSFRLWNVALKTGRLKSVSHLFQLCNSFLLDYVPCMGMIPGEDLGSDGEDQDELEFLSIPFARRVSKKCAKIYKIPDSTPSVTESLGIGLCQACSAFSLPGFGPKDMKTEVKEQLSSNDSSDCNEVESGLESPMPKPPRMMRSKNGLYQCPDNGCLKSFKTRLSAKRHRILNHMYGVFQCSSCPQVHFNFAPELYCHFSDCHQLESFFCPSCTEMDVPKQSLERFTSHYMSCIRTKVTLKQSGQKKKVQCELCGKKLCDSSLLQQHLDSHKGIKRFKCEECDFSASFASHYRLHKSTKHRLDPKPRKSYQCDKCDKSFVYKNQLETHNLKLHEGITIEYPCNICKEVFATRHQMFSHKNIVHRKDDSLACKICGHRCGSLYILKRHVVSHEKPGLICRFCGKGLKSEQSLRAHEFKHTGERPYGCNFCDYNCKSHSVLRKHKLAKHKHLMQSEDLNEKKAQNEFLHGDS